ncbi:hypothetical protein QWZ03_16865 [Chitinimonas viridis]|uniref:Uncharacterized protein n=1 Tax=Chitinimonas viridis TaxID=664880 RepID=A0ABT8BA51_9NEIS|nr:hypothetical protein [Chitinimonas viridis]MDN3578443.1 hypothetical protein [Chitinimonas viridis]
MRFRQMPLTLKLTLPICLLVCISSVAQALLTLPALLLFMDLAPEPADRLVLFLPVLGLLLAMFAGFSFLRILLRHSRLVARLFLMVVFGLSALALLLTSISQLSGLLWGALWLALLATLFFTLPRHGPDADAG